MDSTKTMVGDVTKKKTNGQGKEFVMAKIPKKVVVFTLISYFFINEDFKLVMRLGAYDSGQELRFVKRRMLRRNMERREDEGVNGRCGRYLRGSH